MSLQKMPLPGSIFGLESELALSIAGPAGLDKRALLPQGSTSLAFLPGEQGHPKFFHLTDMVGLARIEHIYSQADHGT